MIESDNVEKYDRIWKCRKNMIELRNVKEIRSNLNLSKRHDLIWKQQTDMIESKNAKHLLEIVSLHMFLKSK